MKYFILLLVYSFTFNLISQKTETTISRISRSSGDPEIIHETDDNLYVDLYWANHYFSRTKYYMIDKSNLSIKKKFELEGHSPVFGGSNILHHQIEKEKKGVNGGLHVYLSNFENEGFVNKKVFLELKGKLKHSWNIGVSKTASPNAKFFLISVDSYSKTDDNTLLQYFVLNENLEVVFTYEETQLNNVQVIENIDNDGSVYLLTNNNKLKVFNALKNHEKWEQSFFPSTFNYSEGKFFDFQIIQKNNEVSFECVYAQSNGITFNSVPIDYYTKEVVKQKIKQLPWFWNDGSSGDLNLKVLEDFSVKYSYYYTSFIPASSSRAVRTNNFKCHVKTNDSIALSETEIYLENKLFTPYSKIGASFDSTRLYLMFNVHKKATGKEFKKDNNSLDLIFKEKLKKPKKSATLFFEIDMKTAEIKQRKIVLSSEDQKKYKAFTLPTSLWASKDGKTFYFLVAKAKSNMRNQHIAKFTI